MDGKANVLFVGSPFWCRHLAALLNEHQFLHAYTKGNSLRWFITRNKSICLVGLGAPDTWKRFFYHGAAYLLEFTGIVRKRVLYWIGSDVIRLKEHSRLVAGCSNIAGSAWLAQEVRNKGYECKERLFPIELPVKSALPLPQTERLQALCYVPDAHHELHGSSEVRTLVERFSDVDFTVIGGDGAWWENSPGNIRFVGWVEDTASYLAGAHVVLRRTSHDSLSAFVREGLVAGRHVIFTYDFPGVIYVKRGDIESLLIEVDDLNKRFSEQQLQQKCLDPKIRSWLSNLDEQLGALSKDYD